MTLYRWEENPKDLDSHTVGCGIRKMELLLLTSLSGVESRVDLTNEFTYPNATVCASVGMDSASRGLSPDLDFSQNLLPSHSLITSLGFGVPLGGCRSSFVLYLVLRCTEGACAL
jgi:hypothetical protein